MFDLSISILSFLCLLWIVWKRLCLWGGCIVVVISSLLLRTLLGTESTLPLAFPAIMVRPGILIVWVSAAHVNGVIPGSVHAGLKLLHSN